MLDVEKIVWSFGKTNRTISNRVFQSWCMKTAVFHKMNRQQCCISRKFESLTVSVSEKQYIPSFDQDISNNSQDVQATLPIHKQIVVWPSILKPSNPLTNIHAFDNDLRIHSQVKSSFTNNPPHSKHFNSVDLDDTILNVLPS